MHENKNGLLLLVKNNNRGEFDPRALKAQFLHRSLGARKCARGGGANFYFKKNFLFQKFSSDKIVRLK